MLSGLPAGGSRLLFPLFLCLLAACAAPWACMSAPHRPRPHRPQPPRRQSAAHGSGSHHATPGPICRRRLPLICRPSCPGSCPPPFCRRSCPAARRRVLCARSGILIAWIYTPPIIPQIQHFPQKITPEICAKKLPQSPLKGDGGTVLALLTARKMPLSFEPSQGHTARRPANRPRPPRPRRPERGGEHDHANSKRIACTAGTGGRTAPALATRQRVQRP